MRSLVDTYGQYPLKAPRSYFEVLLGTIVSQQLSTKAAATIQKRLIRNLGGGTPGPYLDPA